MSRFVLPLALVSVSAMADRAGDTDIQSAASIAWEEEQIGLQLLAIAALIAIPTATFVLACAIVWCLRLIKQWPL